MADVHDGFSFFTRRLYEDYLSVSGEVVVREEKLELFSVGKTVDSRGILMGLETADDPTWGWGYLVVRVGIILFFLKLSFPVVRLSIWSLLNNFTIILFFLRLSFRLNGSTSTTLCLSSIL